MMPKISFLAQQCERGRAEVGLPSERSTRLVLRHYPYRPSAESCESEGRDTLDKELLQAQAYLLAPITRFFLFV